MLTTLDKRVSFGVQSTQKEAMDSVVRSHLISPLLTFDEESALWLQNGKQKGKITWLSNWACNMSRKAAHTIKAFTNIQTKTNSNYAAITVSALRSTPHY